MVGVEGDVVNMGVDMPAFGEDAFAGRGRAEPLSKTASADPVVIVGDDLLGRSLTRWQRRRDGC